MRGLSGGRRLLEVVVVALIASGLLATPALGAGATYTIGAVNDVSGGSSCTGGNAEVLQAVDPKLAYVYETWIGCKGIGFARSTDGGRTFDAPISVAGSIGSNYNTWDPAVAVAPDGTVYAVYMRTKESQWYPVVAASFDHGQTFSQVTPLVPPDPKNWGDRPFIAVGPEGNVYVTW